MMMMMMMRRRMRMMRMMRMTMIMNDDDDKDDDDDEDDNDDDDNDNDNAYDDDNNDNDGDDDDDDDRQPFTHEVVLRRTSTEEKLGLTLCYGSLDDDMTDIFISEALILSRQATGSLACSARAEQNSLVYFDPGLGLALRQTAADDLAC
ncbi:hypothetical protein ElyMa_004062600 [Elysia marginata]|uniref:Uncharacterized protein n=1 Tax=Elysia marginata TaxID=1093978 RepID=A0AAV4G6T8_9GAST|nr:hypothetical protein ElyMa_004062600 [Elysia marginata]